MTMDFKIALAGARLRRQAANLRVGYRPGASGHDRWDLATVIAPQ